MLSMLLSHTFHSSSYSISHYPVDLTHVTWVMNLFCWKQVENYVDLRNLDLCLWGERVLSNTERCIAGAEPPCMLGDNVALI